MPRPLVERLPDTLGAEEVFVRLAGCPHAVWFDSAARGDDRGRYSYVAADPLRWATHPADGTPALHWIDRLLGAWRVERAPSLPPWQGGVAGLVSYDVGRSLEAVPATRWDEFRAPALAVGLYDLVVAFDHSEGRAWAIAQAIGHGSQTERLRMAETRLGRLLAMLTDAEPAAEPANVSARIPAERLAPRFAVPGWDGLWSNFDEPGYLRAIEAAIDRIRVGDAYQVNLSQRLLAPDSGGHVAEYLALRRRNPAPFAGYLDGGDWRLLSASPERFLRVDGARVETRPIKGTRPRGATPAEDERLAAELLASGKDRAENVMIVDLLRNDLSRVSRDDSVEVPTLFAVERFAHVQHLVSVVTAELAPDKTVSDLLAATLPGGSITGAPKVRAQQIIATLEPTARGAYCGALVWVGLPDETGRSAMDSSVLIRTITCAGGWRQAPVGGGIVVDSDPRFEYAETWHKAEGLLGSLCC